MSTKTLDAYIEAGREKATKTFSLTKIADSEIGNFSNYMLRNHYDQKGWGPVLAEGARNYVFGDPLTMHDEFKTQGLGGALHNTFLPKTHAPGTLAHGKVNVPQSALNYGLPAAMTAYQYYNTPEHLRPYMRGSLVGGAVGGTAGSLLGSRFGLLGQAVLAPALGRAGSWLGSKFDKKLPEQDVNPVNMHYHPPGV